MFDYHYSDYFPTQNLSFGVCWVQILGSSGSAMKITVFRDFSFGASKVVPMHDMKACEEVHVSSILNTGSGCRRFDLERCNRYSPVFWENMLSTFYPEIWGSTSPEISEYFYQTIRLCVPVVVFRDTVLLFCELGSEFRKVFRWFSGFRSSYFAEQLFVLSLNFHGVPILRLQGMTDGQKSLSCSQPSRWEIVFRCVAFWNM
jgi:hypothetical protein